MNLIFLHEKMQWNFHCDVAVCASCHEQWGQTEFPSTVKITEVSVL